MCVYIYVYTMYLLFVYIIYTYTDKHTHTHTLHSSGGQALQARGPGADSPHVVRQSGSLQWFMRFRTLGVYGFWGLGV